MLQKETVDKDTLALIKELQSKEYLEDFILVGGTALALKLGHRKSVDIDLFIAKDFDEQKVLENLETDFEFVLDHRDKNTLKGFIKNVKVDILAHKYNLISEAEIDEAIRFASTKDIVAMKLNAISADGTRVKDFIDIYFLLKNYSVGEMLNCFESKYNLRNSMHVLKSLNYFDDVSAEDWPIIFKEKDISWEAVKKKINDAVNEYTNSLVKKQ